jgi:hypothetical protein
MGTRAIIEVSSIFPQVAAFVFIVKRKVPIEIVRTIFGLISKDDGDTFEVAWHIILLGVPGITGKQSTPF